MKESSDLIPESRYDLFDGPVYCVLIIINKQGFPESSVVWALREGNFVSVNTIKTRQKYINIKQPQYFYIGMDKNDPDRWINVRGKVAIKDDNNCDHINALMKIYTGYDTFNGNIKPVEEASEVERVILTITSVNVVIHLLQSSIFSNFSSFFHKTIHI